MNKGKVLIADEVDEFMISGLKQLGYECDYLPQITQQQADSVIHQYSGVVISTRTTLFRTTLEKAEKLRWIARAGSGMDIIDTEFAGIRGIVCVNSPEGNCNSVGEHALGLLLALTHNIVKTQKQIEQFKWHVEENRVVELAGMNIGIVGYGHTGPAFAKKLQPFGVSVFAYDKYKTGFGDKHIKETRMETLFENCDVLSMHVPLTPETNCMVNGEYFSRFKKNIYFINTSRGKVTDTLAIAEGLESGKIVGAGLDVLWNENFEAMSADEKKILGRIQQTGKAVITPHIAGKSKTSRKLFAEVLIKKISAIN